MEKVLSWMAIGLLVFLTFGPARVSFLPRAVLAMPVYYAGIADIPTLEKFIFMWD